VLLYCLIKPGGAVTYPLRRRAACRGVTTGRSPGWSSQGARTHTSQSCPTSCSSHARPVKHGHMHSRCSNVCYKCRRAIHWLRTITPPGGRLCRTGPGTRQSMMMWHLQSHTARESAHLPVQELVHVVGVGGDADPVIQCVRWHAQSARACCLTTWTDCLVGQVVCGTS
jgi:hypothetical protein